MTRAESRFLYESNAIEGEYGVEAFEDAVKAWEFIRSYEKISVGTILDVHQILMKRLNPRIAGRIRDCNVTVGGKLCPPPYQVTALLNGWIQEHGGSILINKVEEAHVAFEKIHPFEDGNGRTGRIIMNWQHMKRGDDPCIIYEMYKQDYYDWFN